jgi:hypothetical protein
MPLNFHSEASSGFRYGEVWLLAIGTYRCSILGCCVLGLVLCLGCRCLRNGADSSRGASPHTDGSYWANRWTPAEEHPVFRAMQEMEPALCPSLPLGPYPHTHPTPVGGTTDTAGPSGPIIGALPDTVRPPEGAGQRHSWDPPLLWEEYADSY